MYSVYCTISKRNELKFLLIMECYYLSPLFIKYLQKQPFKIFIDLIIIIGIIKTNRFIFYKNMYDIFEF